MPESNESIINTGNIQDKTVDNGKVEQNETAKTFSQEQLNAIISERLKKYSDYDELVNYKKQSEEKNLTEFEKLNKRVQELETYETQFKAANTTLENMLEQQLNSIAEEKRKLIPDSFSTMDKLNYIKNNSEFLLSNKPEIKTPDNKFGTSESSNPNLIFGKYSSVEEFAQKDKKGFLSAITTPQYLDELKRVGLLA